jgi:AcrR family transcriptional regulator
MSMARVAARVGVSPGAPYRHFDSLDDLISASAADAYQRYHVRREALLRRLAGADAETVLMALVRDYFEYCREDPGSFRLIFDTRITQRANVLHPLAQKDFELVETLIARIVGVEPDRCRELALAASAVILGNVQLHLEEYSPVSTFAEAPALAEHGLRLLIAGFRSTLADGEEGRPGA